MADTSIDTELRGLLQSRQAAQSSQKTLKNISRALSIVLVGTFVGYLYSLYGQVTTMYAPENFAGPLQEEANALLPKLEPQLQKLFEETVPVYTELTLEKFEAAIPILQANSQKELNILMDSVSTNARERIDEALERLAAQHQQRIGQHFPSLATPEGLEASGVRWSSTLESDAEQLLAHFHERYVGEIGELQATLERFRPNDFEYLSEEELTQKFLHLWLQKLDRLVMEGIDGVPLENTKGFES